MADFEYIRTTYKVPAERGREILLSSKRKGIIVECRGHHLGVNFYDTEPHVVLSVHPTWEVEYLGIGTIRLPKNNKSKDRYRKYLESESDITFGEWIKRGYYKSNS